jgi:hypothetical protein
MLVRNFKEILILKKIIDFLGFSLIEDISVL